LDFILLENILLCAAVHLVYTAPSRLEKDQGHDIGLHWIKACLKRLKGQMPAVTIQIGTELFNQLLITLESRYSSRKERFMHASFLSECKRHILYISVCYSSNGLYEKSVVTQMTERCQQMIHIPCEKAVLESEDNRKEKGMN
jgi:hypothetical protein